MTPSQLAAQLLMIDLPGASLEEEQVRHLTQHPWGGVLLFARNLRWRAQTLELMKQLQALGDPLMAIDQEGGLVDRARFDDMVLSPGAMALAATGQARLTQEAHRMMGQQLAGLGFHLDFAPCVDVNNNPDNPVIGVRSFGDDPERVAEHGVAACLGLRQGGVAATAKHFPGHGDCTIDTHIGMPRLNHTQERLERLELVPFQRCIEAGVESIMTAHLLLPQLDAQLPATLSPAVLQGLLRQNLGFQGVIFTDSLEMQAITQQYGLAEASVLALEAGADMILACGSAEHQLGAVQAIIRALESGRLSLERLQASWRRLQHLLQQLAPRCLQAENLQFGEQHRQMQAIVESSITVVHDRGNLPLSPGQKVLLLSPDLLPLSPLGEMQASEMALRHLQLPDCNVMHAFYSAEARGPVLEKLLELASQHEVVLFCVYARYRLPDATRELGQKLLENHSRVVLVSLSSPYVLRDLPQAPSFVCSYNYTPLSLEALGRVLTGAVTARGRLPVHIPGAEMLC